MEQRKGGAMEVFGAEALCKRLNYQFRDSALLSQSLTHKSYANETADPAVRDNERLEFLGDAVLDFVVSDQLMKNFVELSEGDLSKIRAGLVSETSLATIARELDLGVSLRMGKGEELSGGREKNSILADAMEAVFAAIYLDCTQAGGGDEYHRVIAGIFAPRLLEAEQSLHSLDFKTQLQELVQKRYKDTVNYKIIREGGPDHDKQFEAAVMFREKEFGRGSGRSKKIAEQEAAQQALTEIINGTLRLDL